MARTRRTSHFRRFLNLEHMEDRLTPATFTVTNLSGDVVPGSLRQAIIDSNNTSGADTINFQAGLTGTINIGANTIIPQDLRIQDAVTINGPGPDVITINAGGKSRVFDLSFAATGKQVTLSGLTITGGYAQYTTPGTVSTFMGVGGGILVEDENLTLINCKVTGNKADRGGGGIQTGFYSSTGSYTGGAATVTIDGCTISGNSVLTGSGGGIFVLGDDVTGLRFHNLSIRESTISGNYASWNTKGQYRYGGGICWFGKIGTGGFTISNTTIHNNTADNGVMGGAIGLLQMTGTLQITNSTITDNHSDIVNTGGIRNQSANGTSDKITVTNSIITGNSSSAGGYVNDFGATFPWTVNINNSVVGVVDSSSNITYSGSNNFTGTQASPFNAKLGPLQDNGGRVFTRMPLSNSPVINAGASVALATDGRGAGFPRVLNSTPDIGAAEYSDWIVRNTNATGVSSLAQLIDDANRFTGVNTITFDPTFFSVQRTISFSTSVAIREPLTLTGTGANLLTLTSAGSAGIITTDNANTGDAITMSGITFASGNTTGNGGAIRAADENLTITDCQFINNSAATGGAIYMDGPGSLTISDSLFRSNNADFSGGAIQLNKLANVSILDCTFEDNSTASATASTHGGGAIQFLGFVTNTALIRGCTFGNNASAGNGGAVFLNNFTGNVQIQNSTIAFNKAAGTLGGGGIARFGGTGGQYDLESCIVSNNTHTTGPNADIASGTIVDAKFSALGVPGTATMDATTTALAGQNFQLGSLANNGGTFKTILPAATSPIRDNGSNPGSLAFDARGAVRVWNAQADIGAVELPPDFTVGNANDAGKDSLRQAVLDANSYPGADTITFNTLFFNSSNPRTITLSSGEIPVTQSLTITGAGKDFVTIDASAKSRIFNVADDLVFNASAMSLKNGIGNGGAVFAGNGTTTLTAVGISGHNSLPANGSQGAVQIQGGSLTVSDSTLTGNTAQFGAAINLLGNGTLTLTRSTVSGNTAQYRGGGIYVAGTADIQASTISNNTVTFQAGAGLYLLNNGASSIRNSTISSNIGTNPNIVRGGGIYTRGNGSLTIDNTTIVNNTAFHGGALYANDVPIVSITARSTILAGNKVYGNGPDVQTNTTIGFQDCLIGSTTGFSTTGFTGSTASFLGQNPSLGPLQNNGGSTFTHAPALNSPVLGKGSNPAGLTLDQRGVLRTIGGATDIGAVEALPGVVSIATNTPTVSDLNIGLNQFTITAKYSVPMNMTIAPTVSFPVEPVVGTLTANGGTWTDNQTYVARFNVADNSVTLADVDVRISGGADASNGLTPMVFDQANVFDIDTANPAISKITSTTPNGAYITGESVNVAVQFTEPVTLSFSGGGYLKVNLNSGGFALINSPTGSPITSTTLNGIYNIGAGQTAADLTVTSFELSFAALQDAAGNPAVLSLPTGNNLGNNSNIAVVGAITGITVNDGAAQRSRLTKIKIDFNTVQNISTVTSGLALTRTAALPGDLVGTVVNTTNDLVITPSTGTASSITLTFNNVTTAGINSGSLANGRWRLSLPLLNYTSATNDTNFRRLRGDSNNDGTIDGSDLTALGNAFNSNSVAYDFNNDGNVDGSDLTAFGNSFGLTL